MGFVPVQYAGEKLSSFNSSFNLIYKRSIKRTIPFSVLQDRGWF